jgi:hypothetical protein
MTKRDHTTPPGIARRAVLSRVAAAIGLGAAANVAAIVGTRAAASDDAEIRRLWSEYLIYADAYAAAQEKYEPARAAFDAEYPPCPDDMLSGHHWEACKPLWHKHGLEEIWDARNAADCAMRATIADILRTEAEGLFGIGVKLSSMPADCEQEDHEEAITAVLDDINRLLGTAFVVVEVSDGSFEEGQS